MERDNKIGNQTEHRGDHAHTSLAETDVQGTVDKGRHGVSDEWRQEDERYNGVSEIVMFFQLVFHQYCNLDLRKFSIERYT